MVEKVRRPIPKIAFFFGSPGAPQASSNNSLDDIEYSDDLAPSSRSLSMSRSAADHAKRVGLDRSEVYEVINFPDKVEQDHINPGRNRYHKGGLVVVASSDGCVLAIFDNKSGRR